MKYLVFGETIWDVYPDKTVIGGAPFNFSAHSALLGNEVFFITGLGCDELGDETLKRITDYSIKTDLVCRSSKPTGRCIVTLNNKGIPQYDVLSDTAYDNVSVSGEMLETIRSADPDIFYFNTLAQRCEVSQSSIRTILDSVSFRHIFCDVNIRQGCFSRDSLELCMSSADIVKVSDEEAHFLTDCGLIDTSGRTFAEAVSDAFPNIRLLLCTLGADGSVVYDFENSTQTYSGKPDEVEVVSTVGAGDCYSAAFLHSYFTTGSIAESVRFASDRSSIVVAHTAAIPDILH